MYKKNSKLRSLSNVNMIFTKITISIILKSLVGVSLLYLVYFLCVTEIL